MPLDDCDKLGTHGQGESSSRSHLSRKCWTFETPLRQQQQSTEDEQSRSGSSDVGIAPGKHEGEGAPTPTRESPATAAPAGVCGAAGAAVFVCAVDPHPQKVSTKVLRARSASRHKNQGPMPRRIFVIVAEPIKSGATGRCRCSRWTPEASPEAPSSFCFSNDTPGEGLVYRQ